MNQPHYLVALDLELSNERSLIFLALLNFVSRGTVMAQASVIHRPAGCHPFINSGFSETVT